jgi:hypothetical protein
MVFENVMVQIGVVVRQKRLNRWESRLCWYMELCLTSIGPDLVFSLSDIIGTTTSRDKLKRIHGKRTILFAEGIYPDSGALGHVHIKVRKDIVSTRGAATIRLDCRVYAKIIIHCDGYFHQMQNAFLNARKHKCVVISSEE